MASYYHARSISLPLGLNPIAQQLSEQLYRLRSSQSTSTSSSSTSLIHQLHQVNHLYSCVHDFLQLPQNQHSKRVEESLDRSLGLLDICTTSRDVLVNSKENIQDLQSLLRRRYSGDLYIAGEANEYLSARKTVKKTIKKCLKSINLSQANDSVDVLTEVEAITVDAFKALLSYLGGTAVTTAPRRWSVLAKLVQQRSEKVASSSEFDAFDATAALICQMKKSSNNMSEVENLKSQMVKLESDIQEFDEILECLFRHLVKTRAALLNILSN